ncbi:MAG TPA: hypothetical protein VGO04_04010 [Ensifer sp.]|jgi:hypothetical protein|uniref:hypothetical protein n=1 Tax=Ensifer sp. TaxID=1872086 RepID=UPI002E1097B8|nr:hypothetical protein [Ensifer sp.]
MTKRIFLALFNDSANTVVITLDPRLWQKLPCDLAFGRVARFFDAPPGAERLDGDTVIFKRGSAQVGGFTEEFPHELWGFPRICDESQS